MTPSEAYLATLCTRSFLSLWSYPNVCNDNGIRNGKGIGKEVCDLLVVFGNDIIIFSDKSCEYKYTGDLKTDWNRWYRKAIKKSCDQLYGAERWITKFPERLFLDNQAKIPFPIQLPHGSDVRVHRIAVAVGAKNACMGFFGGGSGSLKSNNREPSIIVSDKDVHRAFSIGRCDSAYVHVFDDVALDAVIRELDTAKDFIAYLTKKEELMNKYMVLSTGEEELLAMYMTNVDSDGKHGFSIPDKGINAVFVPEGGWDDLKNHKQYAARKEENKTSYIWDRLIEEFTRRFSNRELLEDISIQNFEKALRRMACLDRLERRIVGKRFYTIISSTKPDEQRFSAGCMRNGELAFAFVLLPPPLGMAYEEYQRVRANVLDVYCHIVKNTYRSIQEIVGIAIEPHKKGRGGSEVLYYTEFPEWTEADAENARYNQKILGLSLPEIPFHEKEYPE